MFVKLYKVIERWSGTEKNYYLSEISLNTAHISYMTENVELTEILREGKMNLGLNENASFTKIKLTSSKEITVIGTPSLIESKIAKTSKKILRG